MTEPILCADDYHVVSANPEDRERVIHARSWEFKCSCGKQIIEVKDSLILSLGFKRDMTPVGFVVGENLVELQNHFDGDIRIKLHPSLRNCKITGFFEYGDDDTVTWVIESIEPKETE